MSQDQLRKRMGATQPSIIDEEPTATQPLMVPIKSCSDTLTKDSHPIQDKIDKLLCTFQELPVWAQDNIYIHTGYRVPTDSYRRCLHSLLFVHNETGNVYTHLLGCVAFVLLAFMTGSYLLSTSSAAWSDYAVLYTFIATAILCLGCSSLFHLFCCHSEEVSKSWNKCDYAGIVFLIVGSFFPAIYYGFYCENNWKLIYLAGISIFGLTTLLFTVSKTYSQPQYRLHRTALFMCLGFAGLIPISHAVFKVGIADSLNSISLNWVLFMGLFYTLGAVIYGMRIPERWFPGCFDIWFHSHQIFHVFVVVAAILHYIGVVKAFHYHHSGATVCLV